MVLRLAKLVSGGDEEAKLLARSRADLVLSRTRSANSWRGDVPIACLVALFEVAEPRPVARRRRVCWRWCSVCYA